MLSEQQIQNLFRYCFSLCAHEADAYDLLQSAIEKYLAKQVSQIKNVDAYLRKIARNQFIDDCRRKKTVLIESLDELPEHLIESGSLESIVLNEIEMDVLMKALHPFEREVLYLSVVVGYSADEIAQQQNLPRGTVLSRLFRVKKKALAMLQSAQTSSSVGE